MMVVHDDTHSYRPERPNEDFSGPSGPSGPQNFPTDAKWRLASSSLQSAHPIFEGGLWGDIGRSHVFRIKSEILVHSCATLARTSRDDHWWSRRTRELPWATMICSEAIGACWSNKISAIQHRAVMKGWQRFKHQWSWGKTNCDWRI